VEFVVVVFQEDRRLIFKTWRIWFFKKAKLFRQFLMKSFGDRYYYYYYYYYYIIQYIPFKEFYLRTE